jgi:hypothetical protein
MTLHASRLPASVPFFLLFSSYRTRCNPMWAHGVSAHMRQKQDFPIESMPCHTEVWDSKQCLEPGFRRQMARIRNCIMLLQAQKFHADSTLLLLHSASYSPLLLQPCLYHITPHMARAGDVLQRLKTRFSDARLHTRNAQPCIEQERHWHKGTIVRKSRGAWMCSRVHLPCGTRSGTWF